MGYSQQWCEVYQIKRVYDFQTFTRRMESITAIENIISSLVQYSPLKQIMKFGNSLEDI